MRLLFSIIGCLIALGATGQEISQQRYIKITYVSNQTYLEQAVETIRAISIVPANTTVEYRAGRSVLLQPGFEADKGAVFTAHVRPVSESSLNLAAYPNPFERTTTIKYELPEAGTINLFVVDAYGRVVSRLVENSYQSAGRHQIEWEATAVASGVYVPVLQSGTQKVSSRVVKK